MVVSLNYTARDMAVFREAIELKKHDHISSYTMPVLDHMNWSRTR